MQATTPSSRARQFPPGTFEVRGDSMWCVSRHHCFKDCPHFSVRPNCASLLAAGVIMSYVRFVIFFWCQVFPCQWCSTLVCKIFGRRRRGSRAVIPRMIRRCSPVWIEFTRCTIASSVLWYFNSLSTEAFRMNASSLLGHQKKEGEELPLRERLLKMSCEPTVE